MRDTDTIIPNQQLVTFWTMNRPSTVRLTLTKTITILTLSLSEMDYVQERATEEGITPADYIAELIKKEQRHDNAHSRS